MFPAPYPWLLSLGVPVGLAWAVQGVVTVAAVVVVYRVWRGVGPALRDAAGLRPAAPQGTGTHAREAGRLEREHRMALRNRHLTFTPDHHGSVLIKGSRDDVIDEVVAELIDQLGS